MRGRPGPDAPGGTQVAHRGGGATHTDAGTRSAFALAVISCRSAVKSEMVLVATVATGRALRPDASRLDTITTESM